MQSGIGVCVRTAVINSDICPVNVKTGFHVTLARLSGHKLCEPFQVSFKVDSVKLRISSLVNLVSPLGHDFEHVNGSKNKIYSVVWKSAFDMLQ